MINECVFYSPSADKGHLPSMTVYARLLYYGNEIERKNKMADSGDTNSMFTYASMNANGDGIATNKKRGRKIL